VIDAAHQDQLRDRRVDKKNRQQKCPLGSDLLARKKWRRRPYPVPRHEIRQHASIFLTCSRMSQTDSENQVKTNGDTYRRTYQCRNRQPWRSRLGEDSRDILHVKQGEAIYREVDNLDGEKQDSRAHCGQNELSLGDFFIADCPAGGRFDPRGFDDPDESIAFLRHGFNEPRLQWVVLQRFTYFFYSNIDRVFELDKLSLVPKGLLDVAPSNDRSRTADEKNQQTRRLIL